MLKNTLSLREKGGDQCSVFTGYSTVNFIFLLLITFGIFVSYLPQYHRIYIKRTSEGLSTNFLLLGSSASLFTLTNIILISSKARICCFAGELSLFNCVNSQLNMIQIGTQCVSAIAILAFVLVLTRDSIKQDKEEYRRIVQVGYIVAVHLVASIAQVITGLAMRGKVLMAIAQINGLLSTFLTMLKYIPQIYTTYRLKHPGTLSIGMMCIQTPGGLVFTLTLYFTHGSHWSSWISYMFAFLLQGTLLTLCIYYQYFKNHGLTAQILERQEIERLIVENVDHSENRP